MNTKAADNIPELVPPGMSNDSKEEKNNNHSLLILLLIGVVICLLVIIFFMLLKSGNIPATVTQENIHTNEPSSVQIKPDQLVQQQTDKLEKLINKWLFLESEAEEKKYLQWAEKEIIQARSNALQGELYISKSNNKRAEISYQNAISIIEDVKHSKSSVLKSKIFGSHI